MLAPDAQVLDQFVNDTVNILMVGRVAPNKGHAALIEALAVYRREYNPDARLLIVGKEVEPLAELFSMAAATGREISISKTSVVFTGCVSDEQLKAYYLAADFFMLTSEHEGFCVPLVEAMAMKVPIIACASSAIPRRSEKPASCGRNAILIFWQSPSITSIRMNRSARALGLMGRQRYEQFFSNERIAEDFVRRSQSSQSDMNKVAIVVQRCHESIVGGSESLAWHYATLLKDVYQVDILTTTAIDIQDWANALPAGVEMREGVCNSSLSGNDRTHALLGSSPAQTLSRL